MTAVQGVADIDKDIEAASLRALAAQSRLNSALTSVYAKAPAPPEAALEGAAPAQLNGGSAALNGQMMKPAGADSVPHKGAVISAAATSAQLSEVLAPAQQSSVRQGGTAALQQGAALKGTKAQVAGDMPAEIAQGMSTVPPGCTRVLNPAIVRG